VENEVVQESEAPIAKQKWQKALALLSRKKHEIDENGGNHKSEQL
jgi:hypothetical protein